MGCREGICLLTCAVVLDAEPLNPCGARMGTSWWCPLPAELLPGAQHWRAGGHLQGSCLVPALGWSVIGGLQAALHTADALSSCFPLLPVANPQTRETPPVALVVLTARKPPGGQPFIRFLRLGLSVYRESRLILYFWFFREQRSGWSDLENWSVYK